MRKNTQEGVELSFSKTFSTQQIQAKYKQI